MARNHTKSTTPQHAHKHTLAPSTSQRTSQLTTQPAANHALA